ncbi:TIGR02444 family protein [Marinobacter sp.]|uniref:TIGR02444 family protein n=1 Tax=Marinobacter sp. TaxID=50741 RepID=UPI003A9358DC
MSVSLEANPNLPLKAMELPAHVEPDNPLWQFALTFWQQSTAQETCLALQNEGWSVTRILCAGWLALNGRAYTGIEDAKVTEWRDRVTGSLRMIRMSLPKAQAPYNGLRTNLASLELESERIELALAWQALTAPNPEQSNMDERENLIRPNLAAAAPVSGTTVTTRQLLSTLCDVLIAFQQGHTQP